MALCDYCVFFDDETCIQKYGINYEKKITDKNRWNECQYYLELLVEIDFE